MPKRHTINNSDYFSNINTPEKAYFVGFIAADGCIQQITKSSKGLTITINLSDREIVDKLKSELDCTNPIYTFSREQTHDKTIITEFCRLQIVSDQIIKDLKSIGIIERKTFLLEDILENIPKEYRKYCILGYFDGDGGFILPKGKNKTLKGGIVKFYPSYSIQIGIRGTEKLLQSFISELELEKFCFAKYDSTYRLNINHKQEVIKFINIYNTAPFFLKRKFEKIQDRLQIWNTSLVQTISSS